MDAGGARGFRRDRDRAPDRCSRCDGDESLGQCDGASCRHFRDPVMTCNPVIRRRYRTREHAYDYLCSRGFLCLPQGWANGRWSATVESDGSGYSVTVWLRKQDAA